MYLIFSYILFLSHTFIFPPTSFQHLSPITYRLVPDFVGFYWSDKNESVIISVLLSYTCEIMCILFTATVWLYLTSRVTTRGFESEKAGLFSFSKHKEKIIPLKRKKKKPKQTNKQKWSNSKRYQVTMTQLI